MLLISRAVHTHTPKPCNNRGNGRELGLGWLRGASFPERVRLWRHIIFLMVSRLSFGLLTDDRETPATLPLSGSGGQTAASSFIYLTNDSICRQPCLDCTGNWLRALAWCNIHSSSLSIGFSPWRCLKFIKAPPVGPKTGMFLLWSTLKFRFY